MRERRMAHGDQGADNRLIAYILVFEYNIVMPDALRQFKAEVFQALAHPTRIAIIELLRDGPFPPGTSCAAGD